MRLFGMERRPSYNAKLREVQARVIRNLGRVAEDATDKEALQKSKGRGKRLVELAPSLSWTEAEEGLLERCCEWADYIRKRALRSQADLKHDLLEYGIRGTDPRTLLLDPLRELTSLGIHDCDDARYYKARRRFGRVVFGYLWWPQSVDPEGTAKKFLQRWRNRRRRQKRVQLTDYAKALIVSRSAGP